MFWFHRIKLISQTVIRVHTMKNYGILYQVTILKCMFLMVLQFCAYLNMQITECSIIGGLHKYFLIN